MFGFCQKGFEEDSADDTAFVDDLRDTVSQDEDALFALLSAFSAFTAKKIVEASEVVKPLLSKSDAELTALVYSSLKRIIDCQVSSPEVELERKSRLQQGYPVSATHASIRESGTDQNSDIKSAELSDWSFNFGRDG